MGERKPTLRTRLTLESLDGRVLPSGTPTDPPPSGPAQTANLPEQQYDLQLQSGEWVLVAQRGTQDVYVNRTAEGYDWMIFRDDVNGTFAATLLNAPTAYDPGAGTSAFTLDSSKPSLVWDQASSTFYTAPAGQTFSGDVTGYVSGAVNYVFLQIPKPPVPNTPADPLPPVNLDPNTPTPPTPPAVPAPPAVTAPAPVPGGGVQVIKIKPDQKNDVIIEMPGGGSVEFKAQPGTQNPPTYTVKIKPTIEVLPPPRQVAPPPNANPFLPINPFKFTVPLHWLDR